MEDNIYSVFSFQNGIKTQISLLGETSFSILLLSVFSYLTFLIYGLAFFLLVYIFLFLCRLHLGRASICFHCGKAFYLFLHILSLSHTHTCTNRHTHSHTYAHTSTNTLLFSLHMFSPETSLDFCVVVAR